MRRIEREAYSGKRFLPIIGPEKGKFYYLVAKAVKAKRILDLGTLVGYSALLFSKALGGEGEVVTVEYDKAHFKEAQKNLAEAGVKNVRAINGDARREVRNLCRNNACFDLILLDIWKDEYVAVFDDCVGMLKKGGVILTDNALWDTPEMMAFRDFLGKYGKADSVVVPIGDGIAMSVKK
jgi:predicted O-methyltransferase YrrM